MAKLTDEATGKSISALQAKRWIERDMKDIDKQLKTKGLLTALEKKELKKYKSRLTKNLSRVIMIINRGK